MVIWLWCGAAITQFLGKTIVQLLIQMCCVAIFL